MSLKGFDWLTLSMQHFIQCSQVNLSHVSWCSRPFVLHLLVFFCGALLKPTPQTLVEGIFNHLTVALQDSLESKKEKNEVFCVFVYFTAFDKALKQGGPSKQKKCFLLILSLCKIKIPTENLI